jgi:hypothetical protein
MVIAAGVMVEVVVTVAVCVMIPPPQVVTLGVTVIVSRRVLVMRKVLVELAKLYQVGTPTAPVGRG